jgi:predicted membrane protein
MATVIAVLSSTAHIGSILVSTKSSSISGNNIKTETENSKPHQVSYLPSQPKSYTALSA